MKPDDITQEQILDLANCISDELLTSLTETTAFEPLVTLLQSDYLADNEHDDEQLRIQLIMHIINFDELAINPLLTFVMHDLDENEVYETTIHKRKSQKKPSWLRSRRTAIQQLRKFKNIESDLGLLDIIKLELNPIIRKSIRYSIGESRNEEIIEPLIDILLSNSYVENRKFAAQQLANFPHENAISALILALKDADYTVVLQVIEALRQIQSPTALSFLMEASQDFRPDSQGGSTLARQALHAIRDYNTSDTTEFVFQWYLAHTNHQSAMLRGWSAFQLGFFNDNRAITYLVEILGDTDEVSPQGESVSQQAEQALININTPEALAALETWKTNRNK